MRGSVKEGEWRGTEYALRSRIHARERIRKRKRIKMPFSEGQWSSDFFWVFVVFGLTTPAQMMK